MKKILLITVTLLLTLSAFGQSRFYKKYSGYEGMTKVYISPSMFSMMGDDAQLNLTNEVNIARVIKNLTGLYILSTSNPVYVQEMKKDFNDLIKAGEFEILMEVEDGSDKVIMYMQKKDNVISDLYICAQEEEEFNVIYLNGKITQEDLKDMMKNVK
ncbi:MAG: DUF4252 domain-containing protein [Bacteroidales bacterium]|jgi:hypothetical protein|nr:DUF4252 domain-containing protein [Bacteroidales bacterium]MDD2264539.1 DUF4252 domain-containing protein [Bacteroidales bacterium]MDD2831774.1 DUF4252 domain-containing protein [Bacteroidales bacterium]MDD3209418.1 DUF4252 domain-containing protein [Bacteroidales bacterium]MDD3697776.1 DUF4252 domain-containing protein [Bacteroidales bacterium]